MKKILLGFILFCSTFSVFVCSVKEMWYREDDLGVIINGLMYSWQDAVRVFSADERDFIVPVNYRRSKPNLFSGFLRPLKSAFFTVIHYFFEFEIKAYYFLHVFFHACNAVLLFYLLSFFIPLSFAFFAGGLFAFYPDVSWLTWIATVHSSLATFFLLLSLVFYYYFFWGKKNTFIRFIWFGLSGLMFLLSLLSRENGIFFPFWIAFGVFLVSMNEHKKWWMHARFVLAKTWIFFAMQGVYVGIRLWAFGIETVPRTLHTLMLRIPLLAKLFAWQQQVPIASVAHAMTSVTKQVSLSEKAINVWSDQVLIVLKKITNWAGIFFALENTTLFIDCLIVWLSLFFILFLFMVYRHQVKLFLFLSVGIVCFMWPGLVAYPSARYLNVVYPVFVSILIIGLYFLCQSKLQSKQQKPFFLLQCSVSGLLCFALIKGAYANVQSIQAQESVLVTIKKRYENFFSTHTFSPHANFVVIGSPFVSDIQNIFQYFLKNLKVKVAHELFSTVAEKGVFGCHGDYRIQGVKSSIEPLAGGFRFISHDKTHCGWWMHFSHLPMRWSVKDLAYELTNEPHQQGVWYDCSMGKFKINEVRDQFYVTDLSLVFDKKWIDENTVFVAWDTYQGKYIVLK